MISLEQAQERLNKSQNGEYLIIGEYTGVKSKAKVKHLTCGFVWSVNVNNLINNKSRCPICYNCGKMNSEIFFEKIKKFSYYDDYVFDDFKGYDEPIKAVHKKCGRTWITTPHNFLNGVQCPYCRHPSKKKTTNQFKIEVFDLVGDEYSVLSEYESAVKPILIRHNVCLQEYYTTPHNFLNGNRCRKCQKQSVGLRYRKRHEDFIKEVEQKFPNQFEVLSNYITANQEVLIKHKKCGTDFWVKPHKLLTFSKSCPNCNSSLGESQILNILKKYNICFKQEFVLKECKNIKPLIFDFAVFQTKEYSNLKCLIEFDGKQHYEPVDYFGGIEGFKQRRQNDKIKEDFCQKNNIKLIRIPYWEINNIEKILRENEVI